MKTIQLCPAEPERDSGQIATLISSQEDEPTSESGLKEDYEKITSAMLQKSSCRVLSAKCK